MLATLLLKAELIGADGATLLDDGQVVTNTRITHGAKVYQATDHVMEFTVVSCGLTILPITCYMQERVWSGAHLN